MDASSIPIALGEPLGGGMFVSNVVLAAVVLLCPQKQVQVEKSAFMRDTCFYAGGVFILIIVAWDGVVRLMTSVDMGACADIACAMQPCIQIVHALEARIACCKADCQLLQQILRRILCMARTLK